MVPWVHQRGKEWGRFLQREATSGWPPVSLMHRIREEGGVGAAIKQHTQRIPVKLMPREIADFHRAVSTMDGTVRQVVEVAYRSKAPRDEKAAALGMAKSRFYEILDRAHCYLAGRLDVRPTDLSGLSATKDRVSAK